MLEEYNNKNISQRSIVLFCYSSNMAAANKLYSFPGVRQMQTADWQIADYNGYPKPPSKANQLK